MPPSGYNGDQAASIEAFLRSCLRSLIEEHEPLRSAMDALQTEVEGIRRDMQEQSRPGIERTILELTAAFYTELAVGAPHDYSRLRESGEARLSDLAERIRSIHVSS